MQGEIQCPPRERDAEGSRSSELRPCPRGERTADRHHDRSEPIDGWRVSAARGGHRPHLAGAGWDDDGGELERRLFTPPTFDEKPTDHCLIGPTSTGN